MTATDNSWVQAIDLRQGRRGPCGVHRRLDTAVTTAEHLALYRGLVARAAFDQSPVESARITSSADGREVAVLDILRDDRRSDDPRRSRMSQPGGREHGRWGWGPAPVREQVDFFGEEEVRYCERG